MGTPVDFLNVTNQMRWFSAKRPTYKEQSNCFALAPSVEKITRNQLLSISQKLDRLLSEVHGTFVFYRGAAMGNANPSDRKFGPPIAASALFGIPVSTLRKMIRDGVITAYKPGGRVLLDLQELEGVIRKGAMIRG